MSSRSVCDVYGINSGVDANSTRFESRFSGKCAGGLNVCDPQRLGGVLGRKQTNKQADRRTDGQTQAQAQTPTPTPT